MKVNVKDVLLDIISGKPQMLGQNLPLTVGRALIRALNDSPPDQKDSSDTKEARWDLIKKLTKEGDVEITKEQAALAMKCADRIFKPAVWGILKDALTGGKKETV